MLSCRHNRSEQGLRVEIQEVVRQQQWQAGVMPSARQLQAAGQHRLVAAIRQRGGFKTIAAKLELSPQKLDNRGRKPKRPAVQEAVPEAVPEAVQEAEPAAAEDSALQYENLTARKQPAIQEQAVKEFELV